MELILYSTLGCHLCESAQAILLELKDLKRPELPEFSVKDVDIANDDSLMARYGVRIPVLAIFDEGEQTRDLGWPFDLPQLYSFLVKQPMPKDLEEPSTPC